MGRGRAHLPATAGDTNSLTIHFSDPSHGVVLAGDYTTSAGGIGTPPISILETADGGRSWVQVGSLGQIDGAMSSWLDRLHGMVRGKDNSGCALPSGTPCHGEETLFLTNDGGQTWHGVPF